MLQLFTLFIHSQFRSSGGLFSHRLFVQEMMNGMPGASLSTPRILWDGTGEIRQRLLLTSVRKSRPRVVSCIAWPSSSPCRPSSSHLCGQPTRCPVSLEAAWIVPFHEPAHFEVYLSLSEKKMSKPSAQSHITKQRPTLCTSSPAALHSPASVQ